ncbi:unnamed protein product [Urochloa humidicola]
MAAWEINWFRLHPRPFGVIFGSGGELVNLLYRGFRRLDPVCLFPVVAGCTPVILFLCGGEGDWVDSCAGVCVGIIVGLVFSRAPWRLACLLLDFTSVCVGGEWGLAALRMEQGDGVKYGGFNTNDDLSDDFLCVGVRILHEILCAVRAYVVSDVSFISIGIAAGVWRSALFLQGDSEDCVVGRNCLVRFVYQLTEMLGLVLATTFFGGSFTPRGSSSSVELGTLVPVAPDSSVSDDAFQPGRSSSTKQVGLDMLHKTAIKICVASPERRSASSRVLRPPVARKTGSLQGLSCNFLFFQGCSCKCWVVTTKNFI